MTHHHEMVRHVGADMPARYYQDGRRVSRGHYEHLMHKAHTAGRVDCLHTRGRNVGRSVRFTHSCCIRLEGAQ